MFVKNLFEFILYLAPGFIAIELYRSAHPAKERTQFTQIAWSIIYGVFIYSCVKWVDNRYLSGFLNSGNSGMPGLKLIIILIASGLLVGFLMIAVFNLRIWLSRSHKKLKILAPDSQSVWMSINEKFLKDWVVVFLSDGAIYLGWISKFKFDPNSENQDFLLSHAKRVDENLEIKYPIDGLGVYLNTKEIIRIELIKGQKHNKSKP